MVLWKNVNHVHMGIGIASGSAGLYLEAEHKVRYVKYGTRGKETGEVLLSSNLVAEEDVRMYVMYKHPELRADIREWQRRSRAVSLSDFDKRMEEREIIEWLDGDAYPRNYSVSPDTACDIATDVLYAAPEVFKEGPDFRGYDGEVYAPPEFFEERFWKDTEKRKK
ncbi:MAG: hypothetical protein Q4E24_08510 [bacterium]|nr:hypothetical protein [bacterium]